MDIYERAKKDILKITTNKNGSGREMTLIAPNGYSCKIIGIFNKIFLGIDTDGNVINSKKMHVTFSESQESLIEYPLRNISNEVSLKRHLILVTDSTNVEKKYLIYEWFPDQTLGIITVMLKEYEQN